MKRNFKSFMKHRGGREQQQLSSLDDPDADADDASKEEGSSLFSSSSSSLKRKKKSKKPQEGDEEDEDDDETVDMDQEDDEEEEADDDDEGGLRTGGGEYEEVDTFQRCNFSFELEVPAYASSISSTNGGDIPVAVQRINSYNTSCNMVNADLFPRIFAAAPPTSGTNFSYPAAAPPTAEQDVLRSNALGNPPRVSLPKLKAPPPGAAAAASNAAMPSCILDSIPNTLFLPEPQEKAAAAPAVSASKGGEPYFRKLESSRISFTDEFNSKY
jgi:hypothetical protein